MMNFTSELLKSIDFIREENLDYYNKLIGIYKKYESLMTDSLNEYIKEVFQTDNRSFFTICSKESFSNLENKGNWQKAIIYSPLNDHSRSYMHKGDIVFCYRQGQFDSLDSALNIRGIYAVGFVASDPEILFPEKEGHNCYGVCILFPFSLKNHLELRNIQLNPITISLTPYNGNRNDALQYISESKYYEALLNMICRKNPDIQDSIKSVYNKSIEISQLPVEVWNKTQIISSNTQHPSQIIYYGVPGSGKSHRIDEDIKNVPDEQKMRVVFHPEYTNADFVGQIVPRVDDGVDYRFKAGPFSRILKRAYQNIDKPFYLIIEEINRGNASAIFGDLFQLLDRDESGYSKYSVENLDINSYIRSKDNLYNDKEVPSTVKVGDTEWTEITGIRLPPNLSILATMNTSDQNVFALDNAFQRRWDMELVENKFLISNESSEDEKEKAKKQASAIIELPQANLTYTWQQFQSIINSIISEKSNSTELSSMEDKRLGCWFVKACEYESENKEKKFGISKKIFANKVLKYLWDDAFKFCHQEIFSAEIFDFENLQNIFYKRGFGIFSEESGIVNILNSLQSSDTTTQTPAEEASGN